MNNYVLYLQYLILLSKDNQNAKWEIKWLLCVWYYSTKATPLKNTKDERPTLVKCPTLTDSWLDWHLRIKFRD